jgi:hypothetical protein
MWIEYGCNNVGIDACWVRAQAVQYLLPETAPREISADVAAFPKWPEARAMPLPAQPKRPILTVAQAMQRPGERVIVQIKPTNFGTLAPDGHVQLVGMSDGNQLAVVLLKSGLAQFPAQDAQALFNHYRGKQLRVRGIVDQITVNSQVSKWIIEVASPDQIDVWPFKKLTK